MMFPVILFIISFCLCGVAVFGRNKLFSLFDGSANSLLCNDSKKKRLTWTLMIRQGLLKILIINHISRPNLNCLHFAFNFDCNFKRMGVFICFFQTPVIFVNISCHVSSSNGVILVTRSRSHVGLLSIFDGVRQSGLHCIVLVVIPELMAELHYTDKLCCRHVPRCRCAARSRSGVRPWVDCNLVIWFRVAVMSFFSSPRNVFTFYDKD